MPEGEQRKGLKKYLKKLWLKTSEAKEGNRYTGTGSIEGPKQTYTETYHNKDGKS